MAALTSGPPATAPPPTTSRRPATTAALWVLAVALGALGLVTLVSVVGMAIDGLNAANELDRNDLLGGAVFGLGWAALVMAGAGWIVVRLVRHRPIVVRARDRTVTDPAPAFPVATPTGTPAAAPAVVAASDDSRPTVALVLAATGLLTFWTCVPFWIPALIIGVPARTAAERRGDGRAANRSTLAIALAVISLVFTVAYVGLAIWMVSQPDFEM